MYSIWRSGCIHTRNHPISHQFGCIPRMANHLVLSLRSTETWVVTCVGLEAFAHICFRISTYLDSPLSSTQKMVPSSVCNRLWLRVTKPIWNRCLVGVGRCNWIRCRGWISSMAKPFCKSFLQTIWDHDWALGRLWCNVVASVDDVY